jgi:hypothetical protein
MASQVVKEGFLPVVLQSFERSLLGALLRVVLRFSAGAEVCDGLS